MSAANPDGGTGGMFFAIGGTWAVGQKIFIFMQFVEKFGQKIVDTPIWSWRLLSGFS